MKLSIELPRVGRKRLLLTGILSATASTLWIVAPVYLPRLPLVPDADLTVWLVLWGVLVPSGVGAVALLWMEALISADRAAVERRKEEECESERTRYIEVVPR